MLLSKLLKTKFMEKLGFAFGERTRCLLVVVLLPFFRGDACGVVVMSTMGVCLDGRR